MKKIILIMLVFTLTLACCPSVSAVTASSTKPTIVYPAQYEDIQINKATKIQWLAPSSGTVSKYIVNVREISVEGKEKNQLILEEYETTAKYATLAKGKVKAKGTYRISVCAVMSDGSKKWSTVQYFFGASHNGIVSGKTVSFKIYTGFEDLTKSAIYYSARTINNELVSSSGEVINTYPFSQGVSSTAYGENGTSVIVPCYYDKDKTILMGAFTYKNSSGKIVESDIIINKYKPWGNGTASNYDIQNCMTHEMGHVAGITDKYESFASEWTMYGSAIPGETKKRTLATEDRMALLQLYGAL